jgi:hypothetical protein
MTKAESEFTDQIYRVADGSQPGWIPRACWDSLRWRDGGPMEEWLASGARSGHRIILDIWRDGSTVVMEVIRQTGTERWSRRHRFPIPSILLSRIPSHPWEVARRIVTEAWETP